MARARTDRTSALAFDAITVEGALIRQRCWHALLSPGGRTVRTDYSIPKGLTLRDEIADTSVSARPCSRN